MNVSEYFLKKHQSYELVKTKSYELATIIFGSPSTPFKTEFETPMFDDYFKTGQPFYKNILYYCACETLRNNRKLQELTKKDTLINEKDGELWIAIPKEVTDTIIEFYDYLISNDERLENDRLSCKTR